MCVFCCRFFVVVELFHLCCTRRSLVIHTEGHTHLFSFFFSFSFEVLLSLSLFQLFNCHSDGHTLWSGSLFLLSFFSILSHPNRTPTRRSLSLLLSFTNLHFFASFESNSGLSSFSLSPSTLSSIFTTIFCTFFAHTCMRITPCEARDKHLSVHSHSSPCFLLPPLSLSVSFADTHFLLILHYLLYYTFFLSQRKLITVSATHKLHRNCRPFSELRGRQQQQPSTSPSTTGHLPQLPPPAPPLALVFITLLLPIFVFISVRLFTYYYYCKIYYILYTTFATIPFNPFLYIIH